MATVVVCNSSGLLSALRYAAFGLGAAYGLTRAQYLRNHYFEEQRNYKAQTSATIGNLSKQVEDQQKLLAARDQRLKELEQLTESLLPKKEDTKTSAELEAAEEKKPAESRWSFSFADVDPAVFPADYHDKVAQRTKELETKLEASVTDERVEKRLEELSRKFSADQGGDVGAALKARKPELWGKLEDEAAVNSRVEAVEKAREGYQWGQKEEEAKSKANAKGWKF